MECPIGKRIIVVGSSNAGKTTLAEWLAKSIDASFIELDAFHWEPNWVAAEPKAFRARLRTAVEADSWVIAGNYSKHIDISWPLADTIIWLDMPLHLVLRRCAIRTWRRYRDKEVLYNGNRESFWEHLMLWNTEKSLLSYTAVNHRSKRAQYVAAMRDPRWSHVNFLRLRSPEEVEEFLMAMRLRTS